MIRRFCKAFLSFFDNFQGPLQHFVEPYELRSPKAKGGEVDPGGDGGDGGGEGEIEDAGIPPVQRGEYHHPAHEE